MVQVSRGEDVRREIGEEEWYLGEVDGKEEVKERSWAREAKHWLNFGTGSRGGGDTREF